MKAFLAALLLLASPIVFGDELADRLASVPNPRAHLGWVADPSGVIANRTPQINQLITALEKETSVEIAVVVLPTIGELVPKNFAEALLKKWGVGKASTKNGVLVLHVLDQRRIEIETGYGIEGILPDVKCHWITQEIAIPFFKKNSIADGHYEVVRALVRAIRDPNIKHVDLVSQLATQPGATTDTLPRINSHDDIALKFSPVTDKLLYGRLTAGALFAIGALVYLVVTCRYWICSRGKEPYAKYKLLSSGISRLQYLAPLPMAASAFIFEYSRLGTFFLPIPLLLVLGFGMFRHRSKVLRALRDTPRICQCGKAMRRLNEQQDDAYLEKGNVAEESIGSMDYDVWLCDCGKSAIESYKGSTPAAICTRCRYRTYRVTNTRTLYPATTVSTGMREITHTCANCAFTKIDNVIIPIIVTSSGSSRSNGGSGSSGGSFGGGSSGGGGAGSSY